MEMSTLLILGAACHRLVAIWLREELARPLRERCQRRGGTLAYLATCPLCLSVWASGLCLSLWIAGSWARLPVLILAISAVAIGWDTVLATVGRIGWLPAGMGALQRPGPQTAPHAEHRSQAQEHRSRGTGAGDRGTDSRHPSADTHSPET